MLLSVKRRFGGFSCTAEFNTTASYNYSVTVPLGTRGSQLAVLQLDHAGGHCDAWVVTNPRLFYTPPDISEGGSFPPLPTPVDQARYVPRGIIISLV